MKKKKRYNYIRKRITKGSIKAGLSAVSALFLLTVVLYRAVKGNVSFFDSSLALLSALLSLFGIYFFLNDREENKNFLFYFLSGFVSLSVFLIWIIIF